MVESTTLMPVRLTRRARKTHALPQAGADRNRTLCRRPATASILDEHQPTCVLCLRAIERHIAAGVDVTLVTGDGVVTLNGIELPSEGA